MDAFTISGVTYCCGETDSVVAKEKVKFIDLTEHAVNITCPLYIQHGVQDELIPFAQAKKLEEAVVNVSELVTQFEEKGIHCCHNLSHVNRHPMADFLAKHLNI